METLNAIIIALTPAIIAFAGYLAVRFEKIIKEKTRIELEAYHRDALHSALKTGAQIVLSRIRGDAAEEATAKDALLREVIDYARRSVPDAIEFLGAEVSQLLDMAEAKVSVETAAKAS